MADFTPEPWKITAPYNNGDLGIYSEDEFGNKYLLAKVYRIISSQPLADGMAMCLSDDVEYTARLIAAAPAMYEALDGMTLAYEEYMGDCDYRDFPDIFDKRYEKAVAALALADEVNDE